MSSTKERGAGTRIRAAYTLHGQPAVNADLDHAPVFRGGWRATRTLNFSNNPYGTGGGGVQVF